MQPFNVKKTSIAMAFGAVSLLSTDAGAQAQEEQEESVPMIYVWGRSTEMLGQAESASQGIVGNADFTTRPMMRVGELVEVVPGMIATQHSGPGKANQYFLRGMNLDHGSDFTGIYEGMPVNMRSHAHASGYLDLNFMIPELVENVEFHKGTYYAINGDFSAAGSSRFSTYDRLDQGFVEVTMGNFDHRRLLAMDSFAVGEGDLLLAGEVLTRDGPWDLPQDVKKYNLFGKYTGRLFGANSEISFTGYDNEWTSTDQIPQRAVDAGLIGRFGYVDPTLGGDSSRYSLIGNFDLEDYALNLYYSRYELDLFGNPTYFLNDPVNGDQIEQYDKRAIMGGSLRWSRDYRWGGRTVTPLLGLDLRYDDVDEVALYNTRERERIGTVRSDSLGELSYSLYGQAEIHWSENFRTTFGLRGEFYSWDVKAQLAANSGKGNDSMVMPKFSAAWIPTPGYEVYLSYGEGFHSNDVRGAEISFDPVTSDPVDPVDVLVRAEGAELGLRAEPAPGLNFTLATFWMDLDSELLFSGDAGTSEPNDPTRRYGVELSTFWQFTDWLILDANYTWNHARFTDAPDGQDYVPDAHVTTANAGITVAHHSGFTGSLRMRYFGAAPLEETNTIRKDGTTLFNLGLNYAFNPQLEVGFDVLNLLDEEADDIEFWFASQLPGEAEAVEDFHFHPVESRAWRVMAKYKF